MNRTKLVMALCAVAALLVLVQVDAQTEEKPEAPRVKTPAASSPLKSSESRNATQPVFLPQSSDNYLLVTSVVDQFGRAGESDNFILLINTGGQPTPPGISESSNYQVRHGYAHTAAVLHGDVNADGMIDVGDVVLLGDYLFQGGDPLIPPESGDLNCDGSIIVGDLVYLTNYLYRNGPPPCDPPSR